MLNNMHKKNQAGFTLVELMIVVAIIGILAAIAIPQFSQFRVRAFNTAAVSDLKAMQTNFEVFFSDHMRYPDAEGAAPGPITFNDDANPVNEMVVHTSNGVYLGTTEANNNQSYTAASKHTSGDIIYRVTSDAPTIVPTVAADALRGVVLGHADAPIVPAT